MKTTFSRFVAVAVLASSMLAVSAGPAAADPGGGDLREYCSGWVAAEEVDAKVCVRRWTTGGDITHYVVITNPQPYTVTFRYTLHRVVDGSPNYCSHAEGRTLNAHSTRQYTCYSTRQYNSSYRTDAVVNSVGWGLSSPTTWG